MRHYEAEEVLTRVTEHDSRKYTQLHAKMFADASPDWLTLDLAKLAVDEIAAAPTLDGSAPSFTPAEIIARAKVIRKTHADILNPDPHVVTPVSSGAKFAAAYTQVVHRVMVANEHLDFNVPGNYFWALDVAKGVMAGTNNLKGEEYEKPQEVFVTGPQW